jgi:sterol desaturase/sphingolipid hydroxylase (fatty acid hydroxylase superfamily)
MSNISALSLKLTVISTISYLCPSVILDYLTFSYPISKLKIQKYHTETLTEMKKDWLLATKYTCINLFCFFPILMYLMTKGMYNRLRFTYKSLKLKYDIPLFIFYILCVDAWFYILHRILHIPIFYKHIHKLHHYWKKPYAMSGLACHPLEFTFVNVGSVAITPLLFGSFHIFFLVPYLMISFITASVTHSGWDLKYFFPNPKIHDNHHKYFNCNYGTDMFMDKIFGTYNNSHNVRLAK